MCLTGGALTHIPNWGLNPAFLYLSFGLGYSHRTFLSSSLICFPGQPERKEMGKGDAEREAETAHRDSENLLVIGLLNSDYFVHLFLLSIF